MSRICFLSNCGSCHPDYCYGSDRYFRADYGYDDNEKNYCDDAYGGYDDSMIISNAFCCYLQGTLRFDITKSDCTTWREAIAADFG